MNIKLNKLEKFYFFLLIINFLLIVSITHVVSGSLGITENFILDEEYIESIVVLFLLITGYVIFRLYKKEIERNKKTLEEAFKYIGQVNVQLQEIKHVLPDLDKYPENKKELKGILDYLANKALSIINAEWVLIRIVDINDIKTLKENVVIRGNSVLTKHAIPNNALISGEKLDNFDYVTSSQDNLGIKAYFIFPNIEVSDKDRLLIKPLANQIEMIYIIFNSKFYNKVQPMGASRS